MSKRNRWIKPLVSIVLKTILTSTLYISLISCISLNSPESTDTLDSLTSPTNTVEASPINIIDSQNTSEVILIDIGDEWLYRKGISMPSPNWNKTHYNASNWLSGRTGLGYGDNDDITILNDMHKRYNSVYARKYFTYDQSINITSMILDIYYDDGFIAYLNGHEIARANMPDEIATHTTRATRSHEANKLVSFDVTKNKNFILEGTNILAIEIHNSSISSSDLSLNPRLILNKTNSIKKKPTYTKKSKRNKNKKYHFCGTKLSCGTLENYSIKSSYKYMKFIPDDLSGITYVKNTNTFYLINNGLSYVWEVDTDYNLIRKVKLIGFGDSEDIVYLGSLNEFAIVNEDSKIFIGKILPGSDSVNSKDFQEITFDSYKGNEGTEGVTYNPKTQTFYVVKEHHPRKLYSFARPVEKNNLTVTPIIPFDIQAIPSPRLTQDLSAITYNPSTGRLLILSDIDYRVIDIDLKGTVYGVLQLPIRKQPEGITLDDQLNLHIVGEPNNYTIYSKAN